MQNQSDGRPPVVLGLMADPGLPAAVAASLSRPLSGPKKQKGPDLECSVDVDESTLPLAPDGTIRLQDYADDLKNQRGWDYLIYLTDLPRSHHGESVLAELFHPERAALFSLPALGAWRSRATTRDMVLHLVEVLRSGPASAGPLSHALSKGPGGHAVRRVGSEGQSYLTLPGPFNQLRLLSGMVRNNRPGKLLPALSNCIAAAVASGAFGIFYASMWSMADALSILRLFVMSFAVISALSAWLIIHNGLWTKSAGRPDTSQVILDNAATIITVELSVAMMYLVLWGLLFCVALTVIAATYLQKQLGHPVGLFDYVHLAWIASSLGTLAGALGSNFDSDRAIHEATYSRREHERRKLNEDKDV